MHTWRRYEVRSDPGNLVDSKTSRGETRTLDLAACLPNGLVWPMQQISKDNSGRDFRVVLAEGVPVRFKALSKFLQIEDHAGAAIHAKEGATDFRGDASRATPAGLTFRVRGPAAN